MSNAVIQPDSRFHELYNRASFRFAHELRGNPLFELPSLIELSRRRPASPQFAYWSIGSVGVTDRWEKGSKTPATLQEAIAGIADANSLVMLKRTEQDPVFGPLLQQIFAEVIGSVGPRMREDVIIGRGTILIASPRRITAYHIDADVNFLFQLSGDKKISVFDQTNRTVISDEELERYFSGDYNGARYEESKQAHAITYDLHAGGGVHIPCTAPHWAQNSDNVSVALSINFDLRSMERLGRVYRMNSKLRRLGGRPAPPGTSRWRDSMKLASLRALSAASVLMRKRKAGISPN